MYFVLQWVFNGILFNPSQLWFKNLLVIATCCQISYHNCLLEAKKKTKHLYTCKVYSCILGCLGKSHYGPLQLQNFAPNLYFYSCSIATYNPLIFSPNSHKGFASHNPLPLVLHYLKHKRNNTTHKTKIGTAKTWETHHYDWRIRKHGAAVTSYLLHSSSRYTSLLCLFPASTNCAKMQGVVEPNWHVLTLIRPIRFKNSRLTYWASLELLLFQLPSWYGVASSMLFVCHLFVIFTCRAMGMMKLIFLSNIKRGIRWFFKFYWPCPPRKGYCV